MSTSGVVSQHLVALVLATVKGDYHDNWSSLVTGSNNESLCGFSTGWRVPTREELRSIVHYGVTSVLR